MSFDFLTTREFVTLEAFALTEPPTWTRLEPQTRSGDPRPGIEARLHDPLWLLGRQWQLGEFEGEDAATPLTVRVVTQTTQVDRWAPGNAEQSLPFSRERQELLEPQIEREPVGVAAPGLRARAEAGAALLAALDDAALSGYRAAFAAACPLDLDPLHHPDGEHAALDAEWLRLVRLLAGRGLCDAELIARELEASPDLPAWLAPANAAEGGELRAAIDSWLSWYRAEVSPLPDAQADAFAADRFEYSFRIGAGATTLHAPDHRGGDIDWYSFDAASGELAEPAAATPPAAPATRRVHSLLATALRYPGMPADRLWEMEDARVNLGVVESEPWDLARLLVAEFALTYGNDWLVVPLDVPFGSITRIESIVFSTTFGEHYVVRPTAQTSPDGHWRMFAINTLDALLVPPGAVAVQDGPAIEEVLFMRDEMANLAWAIERSVQAPSGAARDRARERDAARAQAPGPVASAKLDYLLQTTVPARFIPYIPRAAGHRAIDLIQGRMPAADGGLPAPLGQLLNRADLQSLRDTEIPREGLCLRRQPSMTRSADGQYARWTTRRVSVGRGEGASQLRFDSAIPRKT